MIVLAYKDEEGKGVVKCAGALFAFDCRNNCEAAWGEGDGECDPEASVRGQRSSSERIPHRHLPMLNCPPDANQQTTSIFSSTDALFLPTRLAITLFPFTKIEELKQIREE